MTDTRPGMTDAERLEAAVDELAAQLTALPEASFTHRATPEEWTAAEVVGHMAEMMPYWARAAAAVAAAPGQPFGRELDDPDRVGAVAKADDVPRGEALARLRHAAHEAATSIRSHDAAAWAQTGEHHSRGTMAVGAVIQLLMVEHAEAHVQQALDAAGATHAD
ncbi:MAG: DinB family protein [Dehalococcoidia bacterium]